jgi:hypothetical protein
MMTPITAPSEVQQIKLINDIYERHGVEKQRMQVIEAHGMLYFSQLFNVFCKDASLFKHSF